MRCDGCRGVIWPWTAPYSRGKKRFCGIVCYDRQLDSEYNEIRPLTPPWTATDMAMASDFVKMQGFLHREMEKLCVLPRDILMGIKKEEMMHNQGPTASGYKIEDYNDYEIAKDFDVGDMIGTDIDACGMRKHTIKWGATPVRAGHKLDEKKFFHGLPSDGFAYYLRNGFIRKKEQERWFSQGQLFEFRRELFMLFIEADNSIAWLKGNSGRSRWKIASVVDCKDELPRIKASDLPVEPEHFAELHPVLFINDGATPLSSNVGRIIPDEEPF